MELKKKDYIQIAICVMLSIIGIALFCWYYQEYIKPKSYTIGAPTKEFDYEKLPVKDYISKDNVLFSLNINDVTFKNSNNTATYEYMFEGLDFNGLVNDYAVFVNNTLLKDNENAGILQATHTLNYINSENSVFESTDIKINFTFGTLKSTLQVSLPSNDLGLLMTYFKNNKYIITVCLNPFSMDETITDSEFGRIDCQVDVSNNGKVYVEYDEQLKQCSKDKLLVDRSGSLKIFTVLNNDIKNVTVETDGTYSVKQLPETKEFAITWGNATYLNISVEFTAQAV